MFAFDKVKVGFVLALLGVTFAIRPVVEKFEMLGFNVFGLSLTIGRVYIIFVLLLALATYLYAICFITQKPLPMVSQIGNIIYAIALVVPVAYFVLFIVNVLFDFISSISELKYLINAISALVSLMISCLSLVLVYKSGAVLGKRDKSAGVKQLSKEEDSSMRQAVSLHEHAEFTLAVLQSFRAIEWSLRRVLLTNSIPGAGSEFPTMLRGAVDAEIISKKVLESIQKVQTARNKALHLEEGTLTQEDSKAIIDISKYVLANLEKTTESELEKASRIEELRHNSLTAHLTQRFDITLDSIYTTVIMAISFNDFADKLEKVAGQKGIAEQVIALFQRYSNFKVELNKIRKSWGLSELS